MAKRKLAALEHLRLLGLRSAAYASGKIAELAQTTAEALSEMRAVIDSGGWYGVCDTEPSMAEKAVTLDNSAGFTLKTGVKVTVKFTYDTTSASAALNVNGTGAKDVFRYGSETAASGAWMAGSVVDFLYDGTGWIMVGLHGVAPTEQGGTGNGDGYIRAGRKPGTTVGAYATIEGFSNTASGNCSHAEGSSATASGDRSHAEGSGTLASGPLAHVEGTGTLASGNVSHAEGSGTKAEGECSHAEGIGTYATSPAAHAEGHGTFASGNISHAEGAVTLASGTGSHAGGIGTIAASEGQTAIGMYSIESSLETDKLIVGKGASEEDRANCFRVSHTAVYGGEYHSSGADYAEYFEWLDGNPGGEDRRGLFVTLEGEKIRLAGPEDNCVLGIVSGAPSVVGDSHDDQWHGMYKRDIFGTPVMELQTRPAVLGPGGKEIRPAYQVVDQALNPDFNPEETYIPRSQRPEWDAVGMMGKLVAVDDGSCQPNGWCAPGQDGRAAKAERPTHYRVLSRLDESHVRVLALP